MAIEDDMRLVSTVELIAIRERVHNALAPFDGPVKPEHFEELHRADHDFRSWYASWDAAFSRKYENAGLSRDLFLKYYSDISKPFIDKAYKSNIFTRSCSITPQL